MRAERGIIPYSTEMHRCNKGYTYIFGCNDGENIETLMEIENCQIRGQSSQDSLFFNEKPLDGWMYMVRVRRLTRKQTTSKPDKLWPEIWKDMSDASKRNEKQNWTIENPKLDNGRKLRGIHIIDPDDGEFKDIMKNACRKLEVPMPAALSCKIQLGMDRHTYRAPHFPMHSCCAASLCCLSWNNSHPHRHISMCMA